MGGVPALQRPWLLLLKCEFDLSDQPIPTKVPSGEGPSWLLARVGRARGGGLCCFTEGSTWGRARCQPVYRAVSGLERARDVLGSLAGYHPWGYSSRHMHRMPSRGCCPAPQMSSALQGLVGLCSDCAPCGKEMLQSGPEACCPPSLPVCQQAKPKGWWAHVCVGLWVCACRCLHVCGHNWEGVCVCAVYTCAGVCVCRHVSMQACAPACRHNWKGVCAHVCGWVWVCVCWRVCTYGGLCTRAGIREDVGVWVCMSVQVCGGTLEPGLCF